MFKNIMPSSPTKGGTDTYSQNFEVYFKPPISAAELTQLAHPTLNSPAMTAMVPTMKPSWILFQHKVKIQKMSEPTITILVNHPN